MRLFNAQHAGAFVFIVSVALAETIVTLDTALSNCPPLGAVLPPPRKPSSDSTVQAIVSELEELQSAAAELLQNATAMSVTIASMYEDTPLLSFAYTPPVRNTSGTSVVDGDTVFRIASVSKVFTVMGLLLLGDKVSMEDPITKYIPELGNLKAQQEVNTAVTTTNWDEITLDALASQLAGISDTCKLLLA
jgi:CubicO group peptidase (beta-lactamase class C family)